MIAFSTFNARRPANALFGRTTVPGREVLCTNPAALGGGAAKLSPIYPSAPFAASVIGAAANLASGDAAAPEDALGELPGRLRGKLLEGGWGERAPVKALPTLRFTPTPDATWGLHLWTRTSRSATWPTWSGTRFRSTTTLVGKR